MARDRRGLGGGGGGLSPASGCSAHGRRADLGAAGPCAEGGEGTAAGSRSGPIASAVESVARRSGSCCFTLAHALLAVGRAGGRDAKRLRESAEGGRRAGAARSLRRSSGEGDVELRQRAGRSRCRSARSSICRTPLRRRGRRASRAIACRGIVMALRATASRHCRRIRGSCSLGKDGARPDHADGAADDRGYASRDRGHPLPSRSSTSISASGLSERESTRFSYADGKATVLLIDPASDRSELRFDPADDAQPASPCRASPSPRSPDLAEVERIVRAGTRPTTSTWVVCSRSSANTFAGDQERSPACPPTRSRWASISATRSTSATITRTGSRRTPPPRPADYRRMARDGGGSRHSPDLLVRDADL